MIKLVELLPTSALKYHYEIWEVHNDKPTLASWRRPDFDGYVGKEKAEIAGKNAAEENRIKGYTIKIVDKAPLSEIKPVSAMGVFDFKQESIWVIYSEEKWNLFYKKVKNKLELNSQDKFTLNISWEDMKYKPLVMYFEPNSMGHLGHLFSYADFGYFNRKKDKGEYKNYKIYYLK